MRNFRLIKGDIEKVYEQVESETGVSRKVIRDIMNNYSIKLKEQVDKLEKMEYVRIYALGAIKRTR